MSAHIGCRSVTVRAGFWIFLGAPAHGGRGDGMSPVSRTIYVCGLMYPPCLSYPLPASGSMYPGDLYPLLDWHTAQTGQGVTHGSSDAPSPTPRRRRTLTSAGGGATSSSSRARSRSTGKSAAAGSPLRAPGGAGRKPKRDFGRARVELRWVHALQPARPERGGLGGALAAKVRDFGSNLLKCGWPQMGTKPAKVGHSAPGAI